MASRDLPVLSPAVTDADACEFFAGRQLWHSTLQRFGIGVTTDEYPKRIGIPYADGMYRTRYVRRRKLFDWDTRKQKYESPKGSKAHLFAVRAVDAPRVVICEGELDAMTVWQEHGRAVAIPGCTNWKPEWALLFRSADVVLALDSDDAGRKGARRIERDLARWGIDVQRAEIPDGEDVNSLYVHGGRMALARAGVL